jgi:hypothetical protein
MDQRLSVIWDANWVQTAMTFTPEEALAHHEKSMMIRRLSLEQAVQYVNGPVYGLTEELFSLQYTQHAWQSENSMGLCYLSPRYKEYRFRHDQTFVVRTHLFGEDENVAFVERRNSIQAGCIMIVKYCPLPDSAPYVDLFANRDKSLRVVAEKATLTIDGKNFKGDVTHYTAPVRYSSFTLYHEHIGLKGEALGPSIEELIQILESLHVLNGKAVE